MLSVIEKVMALQNVDVFSEVSTEHLSHLAMIAEEISAAPGEILYRQGDSPRAMFFVLEGQIRLHRDALEVTVAKENDVFGTWALFDDEPMVVTATAQAPSRLLRIDREDFVDLLADYVQITQGVLKAMVKRLRGLVGRVQSDGH